tara:strand:+ start:2388 stop:3227 length:840 start_codon:yes stop_codon:yes gene_type:complete
MTIKIPTHNENGDAVNADFRLLESRSRLEFHYPKPDNEFLAVFVPFYENPIITENKSANYAEYDVLGRASTLFAYTGAKARTFKVEVQYTIPHLLAMDMTQSRFKSYYTDPESAKEVFTEGSFGERGITSEGKKLYSEYRNIFFETNGVSLSDFGSRENDEKSIKVIDSLLFFTNILRSSVYNNASNPLLGPPVVRLNHGSMYQSIPCIVKSYDLSFDEAAGYDVRTLTPNRIKISLSLAELRTGDFGKFEKSTAIRRDNLAGWESVIGGSHSMDSGTL